MDERSFFQAIRQGSLSGAYYLCGEEPYNRLRAIKAACALVSAAGDLNVRILRRPAPADAIDACEALPFFADRRAVVLRELDTDAGEALAAYLPKVPETTILLIDLPGKPAVASPLYKAAKALSRVVNFAVYEPDQALDFLDERAQALGAKMERGVGRLLIQRMGANLSALENALGVLAGYAGPGEIITADAVKKCVLPSLEYSVFHILDCLVAGNKKTALAELTGLLRSGANTGMGLASFFVGRIKQLLTARALLDRGCRDMDAAAQLGGNPYAAKMTVQNAKRCTREQLVAALSAFADVDYQQKQGRLKDNDALLLAVLGSF